MTPGQIVQRYMATYGTLRRQTVERVGVAWERFGGPDERDAERFVAAAVPIVVGAETATARLVGGYFAAVGRAVTGRTVTPTIDLRKVTGTALRGVDPLEVYRRPIVTLRMALANGTQYVDGFKQAGDRAGTLAETDVVLAQRASTVEAAKSDSRIIGYNRVLTGDSCEFCQTISTRLYHVEELMPVHPHCDCGVAPAYADDEPASTINDEFRGDSVDVAVHEHGEYGPTVTAADQAFTGPGDLA
jgi:hypothetical protein